MEKLSTDGAASLYFGVSEARLSLPEIARELGMDLETAYEVFDDDSWRDRVITEHGGIAAIATTVVTMFDTDGGGETEHTCPVVAMPYPCLERMLSASLVMGFAMGRRS